MTIDLFHLSCDALRGAALVGWKGEEALSRPFELELFFTVPPDTDVKAALGAAATLTATRGDEREPMRWHGVLARVRLLHVTAERGLYAALLVPRLWLLRHGERSYVHTKKRLGDFVTRTLEDGGLTSADYRLDVDAGSYPEEELVIQYHETHLDFVGRWLEREGPYYYFEHAPSESGDAVMVVVDRASQHQPLPGSGKVKVRARTGTDVSAGESFAEVTGEYRARPASVLLCDYDYAAPDAPLEGEAAVVDAGAGVERQYGYRVFDSAEAARLAGVRAASRAWQAFVLRARGNAFHLRAGYVFELEDAQPGIAATRFLAVRVRHEGAVAGATPEVRALVGLDATEPYRVEVEAIPSDVQYRAPQVTPWPRLHGYENGTVDGPASSQYAQIDAEGRYLVRLKFDASSLPDGSTSTYVRMMQPHGGMLEGHHFPLRKGTEVMLGFLGGDVDRPFIAGVVPDARHPSPVTRKNQTQNVIRTGGKNHLVWEDEDPKQYINLYCPTSETTVQLGGPIEGTFGKKEAVKCTYFVTTRGNAGFEIGGSWWEDVTGVKKAHVAGDVTFGYDVNLTVEVGGNLTEKVGGARTETTKSFTMQTYTGAHEMWAKSGRLDEISSLHVTLGLSNVTDTVTGTLDQRVGGLSLEAYLSGLETKSKSIRIEAPVIAILTPSEIKMEPKEVVHKGLWIKITPLLNEAYVGKVAAGTAKIDITAASGAMTGVKVEATGVSLGIAVSKNDFTATKTSACGFAFTIGTKPKEEPGVFKGDGGLRSLLSGVLTYH